MIESYEQMSWDIYAKCVSVMEGESEKKDLELIAILSGESADDLWSAPSEHYIELRDKASFLWDMPSLPAIKDKYYFGEFKVAPVRDFRRITAGQYLDFQELCKCEGDMLIPLLSTMMVPVGKTYGNGYDVIDLQDAMRKGLSVPDALALRAFFLTLCQSSMRDTLRSLERKMKRIPKRMRPKGMREAVAKYRSLVESGVGFDAYSEPARLVELLWQNRERAER